MAAPEISLEFLRPPDDGWTAGDLDHIPHLPRHTELLDGGFFFAAPQREFHRRVIDLLDRELGAQAPAGYFAVREMTIWLDKRNRPEPDVLVLRPGTVDDDDTTWYPADAVLLAVEVVSPDSVERDEGVKPDKYARAGIPYFWRIDRDRPASRSATRTSWMRPLPRTSWPGFSTASSRPRGRSRRASTSAGDENAGRSWSPWESRSDGGRRMGRLIYSAIMSLDGYVADARGRFDWAAPDDEVHRFINELQRPVGTYLYGRRMYETMRYWETAHTQAHQPEVAREFTRIWQAADKIVYSTTLDAPTTVHTRIERDFDPAAVRQLTKGADRDLTVGGPGLAAHALRAGLVDECQLFVVPAVVGGGTRALPDSVRLDIALTDEHRFGSGVVYLRYRVR